VRTPLDNTLPVNDSDLFLLGKTETTRAFARKTASAERRPYSGHMLDLPKGGRDAID
jgi:hypothetical protein